MEAQRQRRRAIRLLVVLMNEGSTEGLGAGPAFRVHAPARALEELRNSAVPHQSELARCLAQFHVAAGSAGRRLSIANAVTTMKLAHVGGRHRRP